MIRTEIEKMVEDEKKDQKRKERRRVRLEDGKGRKYGW